LNVASDDEAALTHIAQTYPISFEHEEGDPLPRRVFINKVDVTSEIRTAKIDKAVTPVCQIGGVREALVMQQQVIGNSGNYVVDGRDIGTVVFPHAEVKIFLTASSEERARRRVAQNIERGIGCTDYNEVLADIIRRDYADEHREISPLKPADDAFYLDSSNLSIAEVIEVICQKAYSAGAQTKEA